MSFAARRVLLAEDDRINQKIVLRMLAQAGHAVTVAGDGRQALELLQRETFDLVLTDLLMPQMDGLELAAAIRRQERATGAHLPLVAMTAGETAEDRVRCLAVGMDAYLSKPFKGQELLALVERLLAGTETSATSVSAIRPPPPGAAAALDAGQGPGPPEQAGPDAGAVSGPQPAAASAGEPVFAPQEALRQVGGDPAVLQELTALFLQECPGQLQQIRQALEARDAPALRRAAHTLKGSVAILAAQPAREAARRLEDLGRQADFAAAETAWTDLEQEIGRLLPELARSIRPPS